MIELCFVKDGIVIGNRDKKQAIDMSYGDMFRIVHQFLNKMYKTPMITQNFDKVSLIRLKEGDGSPYPILASNGNRGMQLKYDDIVSIKMDKDEELDIVVKVTCTCTDGEMISVISSKNQNSTN